MKAYKVEILIVDHDGLGADEIGVTLENARFPNDCLSPHVMAIEERDIGEWDDNHLLNNGTTADAEYKRLFATDPMLRSARQDAHDEGRTDKNNEVATPCPPSSAAQGNVPTITAEALLRSVYGRPDLTEQGREQFFNEFMQGKVELTLNWGDFLMLAATARAAALPSAAPIQERPQVTLPERVIDTLWQAADLTTFHPDGSQQDKFIDFANRVTEEVLARLPSSAAPALPEGLIDRVKAARQRIIDGYAPRRIPADPSDADLVLHEVVMFLEGNYERPFWLAAAPIPATHKEANNG